MMMKIIEILRNNVEKVLIIVIGIVIITAIIQLMIKFNKISSVISLWVIGLIEVFGGLLLLLTWGKAFRNTEYVSPVLFWIVGIVFIVIMEFGLVSVGKALLKSQDKTQKESGKRKCKRG